MSRIGASVARNGEITVSEAKRVFRKFWWLLPIAVFTCGTLGLLAAKILPKRYTSQTLVLVDQPTVPIDYVKPVVSEDLNRRLSSMQEQILSRTRLLPIVEKFGLYPEDRKRLSLDDLVDRLRKSVSVKPMDPMPGTENRSLPGFHVDVTFNNPQIAQQICKEITSMFMEQNKREREQQAVRTTSFLNDQLDEAKNKLDAQDAKLARFKRQYLGSLPEEEQANLSLLTGMNSQLEANVQALSRAQQDRAFNESLLSQQEANAAMSKAGQDPQTGEQQLNSLQEQLTSLRARYTPEHPDVLKLENQIEEFKKRMAEVSKVNASGGGRAQVSGSGSVQAQQFRAKLRQDELNIADLTKRQSQIQDQIRQLQERLQASPVVEQQLKEITRNYQTALDFYNDLLKKREQSAMASDLEHQQDSEQFRVLDAPSLPDKPSFPNKKYFAGGGAGAGVALAFGIMYLMLVTDRAVYTQQDIEVVLHLPVLASLPILQMAIGKSQNGSAAGESHEKVFN
jgi:polysaccharide chain length determinant protein (PEP-CTERM system associated)